MASIIEGFRWALLGTQTIVTFPLVVSIFASLFLLISGIVFFRRMEKSFADVL